MKELGGSWWGLVLFVFKAGSKLAHLYICGNDEVKKEKWIEQENERITERFLNR